MEKLPMCRICLVQNVRMFVVVNRNLRKLYEKLTDIAFVTEDSRPILACFICCTKLKQCYRLLRQCLEAEELLAQKMNEGYELNAFINQDHLEFYSGFIKSPIVHISIVDECQTESIAIKEETPAVCEGLDGIIELKEEHKSELVLELENSDNSCLDVADPPHHSELDLEDDVPLSFAVKEELPAVCERLDDIIEQNEEHQSDDVEPEDNSCLDVADIPPHHSESDLEDDVPLVKFKTEVEEEQEVCKKKRRASETTRVIVVKKPKLDTRRTKGKDAITVQQTEKSDSKDIRTIQKRRSKPRTHYKEPYRSEHSSNRVKKIIQHTGTQIGEKTYKCGVCQRSFSNKRYLTKHKRIHTDEKPYKCDFCWLSFCEKCALTNHIRIHTGEKPFKCDICECSFRQNDHLSNHIRIHTGEKPFKCNICHCSFRQNDQLSKHMRIHTGEKPYKCDVCQRSFTEKGSLTRHSRIHTCEKPYMCNVCQFSFREKGGLTKHMRVHTGEKPYQCDCCQRSFSKKYNLANHIRIHTGDKAFKCNVCQRGFNQKFTLTNHIRVHTGKKPYKCDVCQSSFSGKGRLIKHICSGQ